MRLNSCRVFSKYVVKLFKSKFVKNAFTLLHLSKSVFSCMFPTLKYNYCEQFCSRSGFRN